MVEREHRLNVRIKESEAEMLRDVAEQEGLSVTDVIRQFIRRAHAQLGRAKEKPERFAWQRDHSDVLETVIESERPLSGDELGAAMAQRGYGLQFFFVRFPRVLRHLTMYGYLVKDLSEYAITDKGRARVGQ